MRMPRSAVWLGVALVALSGLLSSCIPPIGRSYWREFHPIKLVTHTYTILDGCRLLDESGVDVAKIVVRAGDRIEWWNRSSDPAYIEFSNTDIVGRPDIYLESGGSFTTTILSNFDGEGDSIAVKCEGETTVSGPTPPFEEGPPPGP